MFPIASVLLRGEGGREAGRKGGREGYGAGRRRREGGKEGGREGGREGGMRGGKAKEGGRERRREGRRTSRWMANSSRLREARSSWTSIVRRCSRGRPWSEGGQRVLRRREKESWEKGGREGGRKGVSACRLAFFGSRVQ